MKQNRNWCRRILLSLLVMIALAAVSSPVWFPRLGNFLVVGDPLEKSDIIVVLGGGDPQRAVLAAELYKLDYAPRVVTTGSLIPDYAEALGYRWTYSELGEKLVSINGVPPRDISAIKLGTSTFEEAAALKNYAEANKFKSMIVITSLYHTRRARMVFRKAFRDTSVKIIMRPAEGGELSLDKWWTREEDLIFVQNEYVKLILYFLKGKL